MIEKDDSNHEEKGIPIENTLMTIEELENLGIIPKNGSNSNLDEKRDSLLPTTLSEKPSKDGNTLMSIEGLEDLGIIPKNDNSSDNDEKGNSSLSTNLEETTSKIGNNKLMSLEHVEKSLSSRKLGSESKASQTVEETPAGITNSDHNSNASQRTPVPTTTLTHQRSVAAPARQPGAFHFGGRRDQDGDPSEPSSQFDSRSQERSRSSLSFFRVDANLVDVEAEQNWRNELEAFRRAPMARAKAVSVPGVWEKYRVAAAGACILLAVLVVATVLIVSKIEQDSPPAFVEGPVRKVQVCELPVSDVPLFEDLVGCVKIDQDLCCIDSKDELVKAMKGYLSKSDEARLQYRPMGDWCVESIEDFDELISQTGCGPIFNEDISSWNVSSATSMIGMFKGAEQFDKDLSYWDVSRVTNMIAMFEGAFKFNQDLSSWNVSRVTEMERMFSEASKFNQDLSNWNVSGVTNLYRMFFKAAQFNGNVSTWDVSRVTTMKALFNECEKFNQDISQWNVGRVREMQHMFFTAKVFNQDLSSWNVSSVEKMKQMFDYATSFSQDLCAWGSLLDKNAVTDRMFRDSGCNITSDTDIGAVPPGPFCTPC